MNVQPAPTRSGVFVNEPGAIAALAITKKGDRLVLGDNSGNVSVLYLPALTLAATVNTASRHSGRITAICLRQDDHEFVTASDDGTARRWRLSSEGTLEFLAALKGHQGSVTAVAYNSKGEVITGGADGKVLFWKEPTSNTVPVALAGHPDQGFAVDYHNKGSMITGAARDLPFAWHQSTSNTGPAPKSDASARGYTAYQEGKKTIEGRSLSLVAEDLDACLNPLAALSTPVQPMKLRVVVSDKGSSSASRLGGVTSLRVSSDGERLVTSGYDGTVIITERGKTVTLRGHEGPVTSVSIFANGDLIAASGWDGSVRIWASGELGPKLPALKTTFEVAQQIRANYARLSANDSRGFDRSAFGRDLVLLARDRIGRNLTTQEWSRVFPGRDYRKTFEEFPGL
jgi:WD40 repeat protein